MLNPFTWLRAAAKAAVIGGVEDALREVQPELAALETGKLMLALPPAEEEEEQPKPRRK